MCEFLDAPESVSLNFSSRKVDPRNHLRRSMVAASPLSLSTVFTAKCENDCQI